MEGTFSSLSKFNYNPGDSSVKFNLGDFLILSRQSLEFKNIKSKTFKHVTKKLLGERLGVMIYNFSPVL